MHNRDRRLFLASLAGSDLAGLLAAFMAAAWLASRPSLGGHTGDYYGIFILLMLPVFAAMFIAQGLYDPSNLLGGTREYASVVRACIYGLVALILLSYAVHRHISREWIVFSGALAIVLVGCSRFALRRLAIRLRRRGHFTTRTLMVGANADSIAMANQFSAPNSGVRVVGFLDDYAAAGSSVSPGVKVLGSPAALLETAARIHADEAIVVPEALPWETLQTLMAKATAASSNGLRVHLSAGFYDLLTSRVRLSERNHVPLLTVTKARLTPFETAFKRSLDCVLALALLVVFAPAMAFIAIRLRLQGSDAVLQRSRVQNRSGEPFDQLSFVSSPALRSNFLRKLPGLVNVIAGQLSLVGPRPVSVHAALRPDSTELAIRPGLTGPWREADDPKEQALLDLYYIRSYTIWLDAQVLFRRVRSRMGSAFRH
jgi:lipopolysaccharide/colanic/teichoic acid biosynthesis glycosyltransferase